MHENSHFVSLRRYMARYLSMWWVVAVGALVAGILALALSLLMPRVYESTSTMYVTSATDDNTQSAYQGSLASQQRVASYAKLATSEAVLRYAIDRSGIDISLDSARSSVFASTSPETVLLMIGAKTRSPAMSAHLANAVADSLTRYVDSIERPDGGGAALAKITVVTPASQNPSPVAPKVGRNVILGFLFGGCICLFVVALRDKFDTRVNSLEDLSVAPEVTVLGQIPLDEIVASGSSVDFQSGASNVGESYRMLRTSLTFADVDNPPRVIVVTSPDAGDGKTSTAGNLAAALAEAGESVVLVDGDLRRPMVATYFSVVSDVGLTDLLRGDMEVGEAIQSSGVAGLDIVSSGPLPPNPAELLGTERCRRVVELLRSQYSYVIIDSAPLLPVTDAVVMSNWADGVIVVVRSGTTKRPDVVAAVDLVSRGPGRVLGLVLNGVPNTGGRGGRYYSYASSFDLRQASERIIETDLNPSRVV